MTGEQYKIYTFAYFRKSLEIITFAYFKNCKKNNLFNFYVSGVRSGRLKPGTYLTIKPVKIRKL